MLKILLKHIPQGMWHKNTNWQKNGQVNGSSKKRRIFQLITYELTLLYTESY